MQDGGFKMEEMQAMRQTKQFLRNFIMFDSQNNLVLPLFYG